MHCISVSHGTDGRGITRKSKDTLLETTIENNETEAGLDKSAFSIGEEADTEYMSLV